MHFPVLYRRERRKQRFSELEAALDHLEMQLQGERNENADLASHNEALQVRLSAPSSTQHGLGAVWALEQHNAALPLVVALIGHP